MFDSILNLPVSYRPVIGFGDDCEVCGGVTFRYGPRTEVPGKGMPQTVQDAQQKCHGHAIYV
jgi:hypothetical protein